MTSEQFPHIESSRSFSGNNNHDESIISSKLSNVKTNSNNNSHNNSHNIIFQFFDGNGQSRESFIHRMISQYGGQSNNINTFGTMPRPNYNDDSRDRAFWDQILSSDDDTQQQQQQPIDNDKYDNKTKEIGDDLQDKREETDDNDNNNSNNNKILHDKGASTILHPTSLQYKSNINQPNEPINKNRKRAQFEYDSHPEHDSIFNETPKKKRKVTVNNKNKNISIDKNETIASLIDEISRKLDACNDPQLGEWMNKCFQIFSKDNSSDLLKKMMIGSLCSYRNDISFDKFQNILSSFPDETQLMNLDDSNSKGDIDTNDEDKKKLKKY